MKLEDYDYIIPIGYNCSCAMVIKNLKLRNQSLPLDWVVSKPEWILQYFKTNFKDYYLPNPQAKENYLGQKFDWFENHRYSEHNAEDDVSNMNKSIYYDNLDKFNRRIERLCNILSSDKKILFVYIGEYTINCEKNSPFEKNMLVNEEESHKILHELLDYVQTDINKKCEMVTIYFKNNNSNKIITTIEGSLRRIDISRNLSRCEHDGQREIITQLIKTYFNECIE